MNVPVGAREAAVVAAIDPVRLAGEVVELCAIPSLTGDEAGIQRLVARWMRDAGLAVDEVAADPLAVAADPDFPGSEVERTELPVVIGRFGRSGSRRVLLVGHVDVVPVGNEAPWRTRPFEPTVAEGRLYARGAVDMKGGVVAALAAARAVVEAGGPLAGEVLFVSVPSEEDGGQGMLAAIRAGATGGAAVITEPSGSISSRPTPARSRSASACPGGPPMPRCAARASRRSMSSR